MESGTGDRTGGEKKRRKADVSKKESKKIKGAGNGIVRRAGNNYP